MELDANVATKVLTKHVRKICHMRDRVSSGKLGLVLGAGVSRSFGFPAWNDLLDRIASHPAVDASDVTSGKEIATLRSQILFEHFREKRLGGGATESIAVEYETEAAWKRIIHDCLYETVDHGKIDTRDHYLDSFLPVVRKTPLTVTYNFDDCLERMLLSSRESEPDRRGYTTLWEPNAQLDPAIPTIYHPNGYLPFGLAEQPSVDLILLERAFADQLIASTTGHYSGLFNHFSQSTCLLMGLSLEDPTLRHILRQTAQLQPGHFHYLVRFVRDNSTVNSERQSAEFRSNLAVHNLVTLFLDADEHAALGHWLSISDAEFQPRAVELGLATNYRYFLAGPVGVGKTTTLSCFRSLRTHSEWTSPLLAAMTKDPGTLYPDELQSIDSWVDEQLEKKNNHLVTMPCGIDIVDRAPLDAFAFVGREVWGERAEAIKNALEKSNPGRKHCSGHIIVLDGDPETTAVRATRMFRTPGADGTSRQAQVLKEIYPFGVPGVTLIDVRERSPSEVARMVANVIHTGEYTEFDFSDRLEQLKEIS